MPDIKFDSKARKAVADALAPFGRQMFQQQDGEWVAVVRLGHGARTEEIKTQDGEDFLATAVKLRITDVEVMTGTHADQAEKALEAARRQRTTAGTLIDEAFDH